MREILYFKHTYVLKTFFYYFKDASKIKCRHLKVFDSSFGDDGRKRIMVYYTKSNGRTGMMK